MIKIGTARGTGIALQRPGLQYLFLAGPESVTQNKVIFIHHHPNKPNNNPERGPQPRTSSPPFNHAGILPSTRPQRRESPAQASRQPSLCSSSTTSSCLGDQSLQCREHAPTPPHRPTRPSASTPCPPCPASPVRLPHHIQDTPPTHRMSRKWLWDRCTTTSSSSSLLAQVGQGRVVCCIGL